MIFSHNLVFFKIKWVFLVLIIHINLSLKSEIRITIAFLCMIWMRWRHLILFLLRYLKNCISLISSPVKRKSAFSCFMIKLKNRGLIILIILLILFIDYCWVILIIVTFQLVWLIIGCYLRKNHIFHWKRRIRKSEFSIFRIKNASRIFFWCEFLCIYHINFLRNFRVGGFFPELICCLNRCFSHSWKGINALVVWRA